MTDKTRERIKHRDETAPLEGATIDYCALNRVTPRKYDEAALPKGWTVTSRRDIVEGIKQQFGVSVSEGTAGRTWERIGANKSVDTAMEFLQKYRDDLAAEGLETRGYNYK